MTAYNLYMVYKQL